MRRMLAGSGAATDTGPIFEEKLGQASTDLKIENTTARNSSVFEIWMPPDTNRNYYKPYLYYLLPLQNV